MATINHTESLNELKGLHLHTSHILQYATLNDEDLLSAVWGRNINDLSLRDQLLHELAIRFELKVFGSC
ncbi:MAG: hypothetical protein V4545_10745 [Pseudomonadota bacterium]